MPPAGTLRWMAVPVLALAFAGAGHARPASVPPPVNVVLVHGMLDTAKIFDPLVRELERAGCVCYAPTLRPNNGTTGVRDLTGKLAALIDARFGSRAPFFLVGMSMGGLAARDYVQNTSNRARVRGLFLISTGSKGTLWANLAVNNHHLRELGIGSAFLRALNADDTAWKTVPVHSYWTPLDFMIVPSVNTRWPEGRTTRVLCPLHPWMPRNRAVMADITARIKSLSTGNFRR